jgi:hypothetical protein
VPYFVKVKEKVELSLCLIKRYAMKAYEGVDISINVFLTSALVVGERSASRFYRFPPEKEPLCCLLDRLVGPRSRSDRCKMVKVVACFSNWYTGFGLIIGFY